MSHYNQDENFHIYEGNELFTDNSNQPIFSVRYNFNLHRVYSLVDNVVYRTIKYYPSGGKTFETFNVEPGYIDIAQDVLVYPNHFINIHHASKKYFHYGIAKVFKSDSYPTYTYIVNMQNELTINENKSTDRYTLTGNTNTVFPGKILWVDKAIQYIDKDCIRSVSNHGLPSIHSLLYTLMQTDNKIIFRSHMYIEDDIFHNVNFTIKIIGYTMTADRLVIAAASGEYYSYTYSGMIQLTIIPYIATWINIRQVKSARKI